jgi:hypothetical protein
MQQQQHLAIILGVMIYICALPCLTSLTCRQVNSQVWLLVPRRQVSCPLVDRPYLKMIICWLVINKAANIIHLPDNKEVTKDCYGWDPVLDAKDGTYTEETQAGSCQASQLELEQQFACPDQDVNDKDLKGLETSLNGLAKAKGCVTRDAVSNPSLKSSAGKVTHDPLLRAQATGCHWTAHDPILRVKTIEAWWKAHAAMKLLRQYTTLSMLEESDNCARVEVGKDPDSMDTNSTGNWQPEAEISDHPLVTKFLQGHARSMNYRGVFYRLVWATLKTIASSDILDL